MYFNKKVKQWIMRRENAGYWWKLRQSLLGSKGWLVKYTTLYRYSRYCNQRGAHIPPEARFAGRPVMPHGIYGVFVSMGAEIGENCVIFQQVTIGSNTLKGSRMIGSPKIGNNVYIGAGAKIIGNVSVGNNVRIGANCVVTNDIPDNATVVLPKSVIIEHDYALDNRFYYFEQLDEAAHGE